MSLIFDSAQDRAISGSPPFLVVSDPETGLWFEARIEKILACQRSKESTFCGDSFSRACRACGDSAPERRAIATTCGHVFCVACVVDATRCLTCSIDTEFLQLREEKDYSRECRRCRNDEPIQRVLLTRCGHTLCACCALELIPTAIAENRINCPYCSTRTRMVFITEVVEKTSRFRRIVRIVSRLIRKLFK